MTPAEVLSDVQALGSFDLVGTWFHRGDGVAVYENVDLGHPELGMRKYVSFGSPEAMLETNDPPERLPDIGSEINWRYRLVGTYRPETELPQGAGQSRLAPTPTAEEVK